jgi:hypothetical protein
MLTAFFLTLTAFAEPPADFTGIWRLNQSQSDNLDPLLKLVGKNFFERTAAKSLTVTQTIQQTETSLVIEVSSAVMGKNETLAIDGTPVESLDRDGLPLTSVTNWEGTSLVTKTESRIADGTKIPMALVRYIAADGTQMVQEIRYGEGEVLKRVFDKQVPK